LRDYKEAIKYLNPSITIDSSDARAYNSLGYVYFLSKNYNHAIACYNKAIAKGGANYKPYYQYLEEATTGLKKHQVSQYTHLAWISPIEDVNKLFKGTIQLSGKPQIAVKVKISSTKPISKQNIQLMINDLPVTDPDKISILETKEMPKNIQTGFYEYEYHAVIQVTPGQNVVKVVYGKKHTPELTIAYNTPISEAYLSN